MRKKGLDPPGLCDVCYDFVPVLIAKWKSGSDCGIDFFSPQAESYLHKPVFCCNVLLSA